jgi:hypothetical protein
LTLNHFSFIVALMHATSITVSKKKRNAMS